jgi:hypothetical protein
MVPQTLESSRPSITCCNMSCNSIGAAAAAVASHPSLKGLALSVHGVVGLVLADHNFPVPGRRDELCRPTWFGHHRRRVPAGELPYLTEVSVAAWRLVDCHAAQRLVHFLCREGRLECVKTLQGGRARLWGPGVFAAALKAATAPFRLPLRSHLRLRLPSPPCTGFLIAALSLRWLD